MLQAPIFRLPTSCQDLMCCGCFAVHGACRAARRHRRSAAIIIRNSSLASDVRACCCMRHIDEGCSSSRALYRAFAGLLGTPSCNTTRASTVTVMAMMTAFGSSAPMPPPSSPSSHKHGAPAEGACSASARHDAAGVGVGVELWGKVQEVDGACCVAHGNDICLRGGAYGRQAAGAQACMHA